jgi:hypothetical protein
MGYCYLLLGLRAEMIKPDGAAITTPGTADALHCPLQWTNPGKADRGIPLSLRQVDT